MHDTEQMLTDLQALHEAIDEESSLQDIRIATLRALTRHRFYTDDMLKLTHDWDALQQYEERSRRHEEFQRTHREELGKIFKEKGARGVGEYLNANVPHLPEGIHERANSPVVRMIKECLQSIAYVCTSERDPEGDEYWQALPDDDDDDNWELPDSVEIMGVKVLSPEEDAAFRLEHPDRFPPEEPAINDDEPLYTDGQKDEKFEEYRLERLRDENHTFNIYLMVFERRLKLGATYSGLDLMKDQEMIPMPSVKPDTDQPDKRREKLIAKLEELTDVSFR